MTVRAVALMLLTLEVAACAAGEPQPSEADRGFAEGAAPSEARRTYERSFVFSALAGDSAFLVPWLTTVTVSGDSATRAARGWLARSGAWDLFYSETWKSLTTRPPQRLLPHGSMRLTLGDAGNVNGILYEEEGRQLEVTLGSVLMEWGTPWGQALRLTEGAVYLSDQRLSGMVLSVSRAYPANEARPGDWAFLTSGDSLQVVLAAPPQRRANAEPPYQGWARLELQDLRWTRVDVEWTETRSFPAARRDVPVSWSVSSPAAEVEGTLTARSSEVSAGEGEGPQLPVDGLFDVEGTLTIHGRVFEVSGLFYHSRG